MWTRLLITIAVAAALSACASVHLSEVAPTVMRAQAANKEASAKAATSSKEASQIFPCKTPMTIEQLNWQALSAQHARDGLPDPLQSDPVVVELTNAVAYQVALGRRAALEFLGQDAQAENAVHGISAGRNLSNSDFKRFAHTLAATALNPVVAADPGVRSGQATNPTLLDYYNAYYNDGFHDRFGVAIAKPKNIRNISDDDIAGAVSIALEFLLDTLLNTPVWKDENNNYYPGKFTDQPSVMKLKGIAAEPLLDASHSKECGITPLKAEAIAYLSKAAGDRAAMLGGLTTGSFGGLNFGFGVLGKWSIGDNQTLQVIVKTALSRAFARGTEQVSYEILENVGYQDDKISELLKYVFDQGKL
jgi:hypothetical protein